jgi:steroid delta-isomerase-like uncharacterized protein
MTIAAAMRFYEAYNSKNVDLLDDVLAPGYVGQVNGREIAGAQAAKGFIRALLAAFPDLHYTIHQTIASGDEIVTRWSATGTHLGSFAGVEPTQKRVTMLGITIFQLVDQQISALWSIWDVNGVLQQLRQE